MRYLTYEETVEKLNAIKNLSKNPSAEELPGMIKTLSELKASLMFALTYGNKDGKNYKFIPYLISEVEHLYKKLLLEAEKKNVRLTVIDLDVATEEEMNMETF